MHVQIQDFLLASVPKNCAAVTLTMKQRDAGCALDMIEAQKNFRHFMNILNKKAYGNAFSRFGKRLRVVPVLERSYDGRLHYHASIENPYDDLSEFDIEIFRAWTKTRWGYTQTDVQHQYSDGWIDYIMKSKSFDNLDIENLHRV